jgi:hypothetical protein
MSHSQWIFHNYTLHDKQRGYLRLRLHSDTLREIHELLETPPSDIPPQSQYLLELDHSSMYNVWYEDQVYWVLALKAARRAGRWAAVLQRSRGRSQRNRLAATTKKKICYDLESWWDRWGTNSASRCLPENGHTPPPSRSALAQINGYGNQIEAQAAQPNTLIR